MKWDHAQSNRSGTLSSEEFHPKFGNPALFRTRADFNESPQPDHAGSPRCRKGRTPNRHTLSRVDRRSRPF